jgi:4-amino-4-deoxy-L-arabinose transferase-like glycosyltransferase
MKSVDTVANTRHVIGSPSRAEWWAIALLFSVGLAVRAWHLADVGLNQYDEGVYVFSALGVADPSQPHRMFPRQIYISPPVYFSLVAALYKTLGRASDTAAFAVNTLTGSLTILLLWGVVRRWFGSGAALAAATFVSLSEFHIAFSRMALTDVTFAFLFIAALTVTSLALDRQDIRLAVIAGLMVGLAWNTKYHGWFVVVVAAAAVAFEHWRRGPRWSVPIRPIILLVIIAAVGAACYLPWALFIESQPGGYASLAAHHRELMDRDWLGNVATYAQAQRYFEGPLSRAAPLVAALAAGAATGALFQQSRRVWLVLGLAAGMGAGLGSAGTALLMSLAAVARLLRRPGYASGLLLAWLGLWVVAAPIYHPYARLLLPFTLATYVGAAFWLSYALAQQPGAAASRRSIAPLVAGGAAVAATLWWFQPDPDRSLWRPSRSFADAARAMTSVIPAGERVIVVGEPQLAFYLHLAGRRAFERVDSTGPLARLDARVYVVTGVYAKRAPPLRAGFKALAPRLTVLGVFPVRPNDVRLLDDLAAPRARAYVDQPDDTFDLTLYELQPAR